MSRGFLRRDGYLLLGQSNMMGLGDATSLAAALQTNQRRIHADWFVRNSGGVEQSSSGWYRIAPRPGSPDKHGPEITFAQDMADGGYNTAIVKFAEAATTLAEDWVASTGRLYLEALAFYHTALAGFYFPFTLRGVIWMQGETDAATTAFADAYEANLTAFIAALRADLGEPDLPVFVHQLHAGTLYDDTATVIAAQQAVAAADANVYIEDADLEALGADNLHMTSAGQQLAGSNLATLALALL